MFAYEILLVLGGCTLFRTFRGAMFARTVGQRGRIHYLLRRDYLETLQTSDRVSHKKSTQMGRQRHRPAQVPTDNGYVSACVYGGVYFNYSQLYARELQLALRRCNTRWGAL